MPGCANALVTETDIVVGQVAHIEAAEPGGPRFEPTSTDEIRRSLRNLILLCPSCHLMVDTDVGDFPAQKLRTIKAQHESTDGKKLFELDERVLRSVRDEMETYWQYVEQLHRDAHVLPELAVPIMAERSFIELMEEAHALIASVEAVGSTIAENDERASSELRELLVRQGAHPATVDALSGTENPFADRHWELTSLTLPNLTARLSMLLRRLELLYLEEYVGTHPSDRVAFDRLADAKATFSELAVSAGLRD